MATRPEEGWMRRSASELTGLAASVVFATEDTTLTEAVRVAGTRWTIESCVEAAKNEVGLDHDEVRSWTGVSASHAGDVALALLAVLGAWAVAVEALQKTRGSCRGRAA